jgi:hypothetical protein
VTSISDVQNKKHQVTQIDIKLSGPVDASQAKTLANYTVLEPGIKGSFNANNAKAVKVKSVNYNAAINEIIVTPRTPFALTKPVQLTINASSSKGIHDTAGRLINGGHNDVVVIRKGGMS